MLLFIVLIIVPVVLSQNTDKLSDDILKSVPDFHLQIIMGNILADGSIQKTRNVKTGEYVGKGVYAISIDTYSYDYLMYLYNTVYRFF